MGSIVKGVASLFGGRKRRREQRAANQEFDQAKAGVTDFLVNTDLPTPQRSKP